MDVTQVLFFIAVTVPLVFVTLGRLRVDLAAILIAISLAFLQWIGFGILGEAGQPQEAVNAISGFGKPVVLTLIGLFVISHSLDKSGVTRWIVRNLLRLGGKSEARLIALFAGSTALLSLIMNNLAAGALLLPSAMEASRRTGVKPSKLLIPVAYGSLLGGAATYFTTANIIVSDLLRIANPPQRPLNILDFTPTGGLIAIAGIAFLAIAGKRLLPEREPPLERISVRPTGSELEDRYRLGERLWDAVILPESSLADKSLGDSNIGERSGVTVIAINRGASTIFAPPSTYKLQSRDVLVLVGREDRVLPLSEEGLKITREEETEHVSPRGVTMQELLLAPHSTAEGKTLKELNFRQYYGFTAIALWRKGRSYRTEVGNFPLEFGDSLLVVGPPTHIRRLKKDPNFIVLESSLSDQPVYRAQATRAGIVTLGAILMSILGVPVFLSMLAGAAFLILTRSISMEEAYTAVEWPAIFLVAAMYSVSLGMVQTGLADILGTAMVNLASPFGPLGLAAGAYLLTSLLTQFMGGQVTALVTGPIAITAAISMGTNPQAIAVATAIGCSASFLLPISHPVNILMIAPANYRIVDFLRSGLPLTLISFAGLIAGMILFWRL